MLKGLRTWLKTLIQVAHTPVDRLLLTGFYPRTYDMNLEPNRAMGDYIETYVERDLRRLINVRELGLFEKFL